MKGWCTFCEQVVQAHQTAAYAVDGWEVERKGGGANAIKGRRRTGNVAHVTCLERYLRVGSQESMFDG